MRKPTVLILAEDCELSSPPAPPSRKPGLEPGPYMVGQSSAIMAIRSYLQRVAQTASNVLITGETGTGKELIAELIHRNSARAAKPMVCINCAAIPDTLLESELFGYERGAFTGAHASQDGKLKMADGSTLFLDEIGDMSAYAQAKMLRVLEGKQIQRLGSMKAQQIDFRLIAATNVDLKAFTEGFYGKVTLSHLAPVLETLEWLAREKKVWVEVTNLMIPGLNDDPAPERERQEDILPLADFFRREYNRKFRMETASFTSQAEQSLLSHDWPGNVRELKNTIEAAFINMEPEATQVSMPTLFCQVLDRKEEAGVGEVERILLALSQTRWNRSKAAEKLHWSRMTLYRKMARYQISSAAKEPGRCAESAAH